MLGLLMEVTSDRDGRMGFEGASKYLCLLICSSIDVATFLNVDGESNSVIPIDYQRLKPCGPYAPGSCVDVFETCDCDLFESGV